MNEKQRTLARGPIWLHTGSMPSDRDPLHCLKNLISEVDLILETTPPLPQNRTGRSRDLLRAALALTDDLISLSKMPAA